MQAFDQFSRWTAWAMGHPVVFIVALLGTVIWAVSGPIFHFSDTWQLVINTATTVLTFLMVFLIQNAVNRDSVAVQLKLDELIRAVEGARNSTLRIEDLSGKTLRDCVRSSTASFRVTCLHRQNPKCSRGTAHHCRCM
jgi:low affinity Fe/Cu permease